MNKIKIYQVDAFAKKAFEGNPAAVCPLENWLEDEQMQQVAEEMNLSETCFFVKNGKEYDLRWFTPQFEVDLCGHATLAAAHVIQQLGLESKKISFHTRSGVLNVLIQSKDTYQLNFPSDNPALCENENVQKALKSKVLELYQGKDDYLVILESEEQVKDEEPDLELVKKLGKRGLILSAPSTNVDFVSRCFYPAYGIPEDPVTGSAHCLLTPYWAVKLQKNNLKAKQLSKRGGEVYCQLSAERILLQGQAISILEGTLEF